MEQLLSLSDIQEGDMLYAVNRKDYHMFIVIHKRNTSKTMVLYSIRYLFEEEAYAPTALGLLVEKFSGLSINLFGQRIQGTFPSKRRLTEFISHQIRVELDGYPVKTYIGSIESLEKYAGEVFLIGNHPSQKKNNQKLVPPALPKRINSPEKGDT